MLCQVSYARQVAELPSGWTIQRIRDMGVREVRLLPVEDRDVFEQGVDDYVQLDPTVIIDCGGLYLVHDRGDGMWHMGDVEDDGTIVCWAGYGQDLADAIRAL